MIRQFCNWPVHSQNLASAKHSSWMTATTNRVRIERGSPSVVHISHFCTCAGEKGARIHLKSAGLWLISCYQRKIWYVLYLRQSGNLEWTTKYVPLLELSQSTKQELPRLWSRNIHQYLCLTFWRVLCTAIEVGTWFMIVNVWQNSKFQSIWTNKLRIGFMVITLLVWSKW